MDQVLDRIAAWEAAGLIDAATAERLRAAETAQARREAADATTPAGRRRSARRGPSSVAAIFGPGITIGEMFAYLGGAFLLGAYETFVVRSGRFGAGSESARRSRLGLGGDRVGHVRLGTLRRRRRGGVGLRASCSRSRSCTSVRPERRWPRLAGIEWPASGVIGAALATLVAIGLRLLHPSLLTQVALLVSVTTFAGLLLGWLESVVVPQRRFDDIGNPVPVGGPDPLLLVAGVRGMVARARTHRRPDRAARGECGR